MVEDPPSRLRRLSKPRNRSFWEDKVTSETWVLDGVSSISFRTAEHKEDHAYLMILDPTTNVTMLGFLVSLLNLAGEVSRLAFGASIFMPTTYIHVLSKSACIPDVVFSLGSLTA